MVRIPITLTIAAILLVGCGESGTGVDPLGLDAAIEWKRRVEACAELQVQASGGFDYRADEIEDALSRVQVLSGLKIRLTPEARGLLDAYAPPPDVGSCSIGPDEPGPEVEFIIDCLARDLGGEWGCVGTDVLIGARGEIEGWLNMRFYEVRDLVGSEYLFQPWMAADAPPDNSVPTLIAPDVLTATIMRFVDPVVWTSPTRALVQVRNGILVARAPDPTLQKIADYLEGSRVAVEREADEEAE